MITSVSELESFFSAGPQSTLEWNSEFCDGRRQVLGHPFDQSCGDTRSIS